jgi:hypothetical protein
MKPEDRPPDAEDLRWLFSRAVNDHDNPEYWMGELRADFGEEFETLARQRRAITAKRQEAIEAARFRWTAERQRTTRQLNALIKASKIPEPGATA